MSSEHSPGGYKLILVAAEYITGTIPATGPPSVHPEYVKVVSHVPYEVVADVGEDRKITMYQRQVLIEVTG